MQQYFDISSGSGTLTVFHTEDTVSFDVEHYGNFSTSDERLVDLLSTEGVHTITTNPAEEHPSLAETRPQLYPDEDQFVGEITVNSDGSIDIYIDNGQREVTVSLTPAQAETLRDSITIGSVERYDDGQYPVEFVSKDGERDRAEH